MGYTEELEQRANTLADALIAVRAERDVLLNALKLARAHLSFHAPSGTHETVDAALAGYD